MRSLFISLLLLQFVTLSLSADLQTYYKDFMEAHGYPLEENLVLTDDGYILSVWHLTPKEPNGRVVFLQHGCTDTAWTFFQLGDNSLPFILLREGYDVWLGNVRGNIFSHNHIDPKLSEVQSGFNEHSMDEMVEYDLPAMINMVREKTGAKKITYIGHSQGTTIFFMLVMHNPAFAEEVIDHYVALGTVNNIANTLFPPIEILDRIAVIFQKVGIFKYMSLTNAQRNLVAKFCKTSPGVCGKAFDYALSIKPSGRMDYKNLYHYLYYYPGGVSKNNMLHWSQIHQMKQLVYFNPRFDKEKTAIPYNIENIKKWKIKSLIQRSDDDTFSAWEDVTDFYNTVEDKSYITMLDTLNYGHVDCTSAESAIKDIFEPLLEFIKN